MSVNWIATLLIATAHALSGGSPQSPTRYPGSIAFFLPNTLTQERCSAVKIAPKTFLTAAHCFDLLTDTKIVFAKPSELLSRKIISHINHPRYYPMSAWFAASRNWEFWNDVDLAIVKVDQDVDGLTIPTLATTVAHPGQRIVIGGYGPKFFDQECTARPCSLNMGVATVSEFSNEEILLAQKTLSDVFFTGGDSGGPAYDLSSGHPIVIGINQSCDNLGNPQMLKTSRLTRLDLAWIKANR